MTAAADTVAGAELTPLVDYLGGVLRQLRVLPPLDLDLHEAYKHVLAQDVIAPGPLPAFDHASVDGYAVRAEDIAAADADRPVRLNVIGDLAASSWRPVRITPGTCFSICLLYTSPSPRDRQKSRMPSSA